MCENFYSNVLRDIIEEEAYGVCRKARPLAQPWCPFCRFVYLKSLNKDFETCSFLGLMFCCVGSSASMSS